MVSGGLDSGFMMVFGGLDNGLDSWVLVVKTSDRLSKVFVPKILGNAFFHACFMFAF